METPRDDHSGELVLTHADRGVGLVAAFAVAGATYLGLNSTSNVAAILAFAAAVFVALLTAYWTQRRLSQELAGAGRRQVALLSAETERQAQQLRSEADRLRLRLAHDRQLHDLAELRGVLDDAVDAVEVARNSFNQLARVSQRDPYVEKEGRVAYNELMINRRKVETALARITVRGQDDLARAIWGFDRALIPPTVNPNLPEKTPIRAAWEDARSELAGRQADFLSRARALVPSDVPAPDPGRAA